MELLKLLGVLIVIVGFALKLDSILIIVAAAVVTAFVGGIGPMELLDMFGSTFVANRGMCIFIVVMLVTGTLERNGLREAAANLIGKVKGATPGKISAVYTAIRSFFGAFNVGIGGIAGFVRPVLMPMCTASLENKGIEPNEEHVDKIKGMTSAAENIAWFFFQVLVVGGSGGLLVQGTLAGLGYEVALIDLVKVEVPVALFALVITMVYFLMRDNKLIKKYYGNKGKANQIKEEK